MTTSAKIAPYTTGSLVKMASPILSAADGSSSPIFNEQPIHPLCPINYNKCDPSLQHTQYNNKRSFEYMNDDTSTVYHDDDDRTSIDDSEDLRGKKPGRKPMTEEEFDDDDEDPKIKRKAQNRAAQRAFRERKERYVKELEQKIKYVQDNHIYATTQLFQENQHLRSIIYSLELDLDNLKGVPPGAPGNKSWLTTVGLPPSINYFQPAPPHSQSYSPLQIRPSPIANKLRKIVPNIPEKQKKQKTCFKSDSNHAATQESKNKSSTDTLPSPPSPALSTATENPSSSQQFTFSITTPATLRASSDNELIRKNEQIQVVQLYPDHCHPANCLLESKKQHNNSIDTPTLSPSTQYNPSSIASSVISYSSSSSDEEEKTFGGDQEFSDILKPFFDTRGNFNFTTTTTFNNNNEQMPSNNPSSILNQLLEEANNNTTSWNLMINNSTY